MAWQALLAPALGILLSPFGIIPAILLQFSPRPRASGLAFLVGWAGGILAGFLLAAGLSDRLGGAAAGPWLARVQLLAGVGLMTLGAVRWRQRKPDGGAIPAWMAGLADSRPSGALRLGLLLSLANPKVLLLAIGAGLLVAGAGLGAGGGLVAAGLGFALCASLGVGLPLLLPILLGARVLEPMDRGRQWLIVRNDAITALLLLGFGALLVAKGLPALA